MKKKQILSLLLAVGLILCLTACSGSGTSSNGTSSAGGSAGAPAGSGNAGDSKWPTGSVSLYVPATAGGGTDMIARVFTKVASEVAGKPVVVVNDTTGGGTVAAETVRNADTEGLDLLLTNTGFCATIAAGQYAHTMQDFTILGAVTTEGLEGGGIFVNKDSPFETLEDLISYAKEHPGELNAGVQNNSSSHYVQILFEQEVGISTTIVDAGSNADKVTKLMGGSIDLCVLANTGTSQYVESGDLRCLVQLSSNHSELIPDAPTMEDLGYNSCYLGMSMILLGPPNMDPADCAKIDAVLKECSESSEVQEGYATLGAEWNYMTREETAAYLEKTQADYDAAYALMNG